MSAPGVFGGDAANVEGIEKKIAEVKKEVAEIKKEVADGKKEVVEAEKKVAEAKKEVAEADKKVGKAMTEVKAAQNKTKEEQDVATTILTLALDGLTIALDGLKTAQKGLATSEEERELQVSRLKDVLNELRHAELQTHQAAGATPAAGAAGGAPAAIGQGGGFSPEQFLQALLERDEQQRKDQRKRDEEQCKRDEQQRKDQRKRDEEQFKRDEQHRKDQRERDERQYREQLQIFRHLMQPQNPWAEMARTSAASDTSSQQGFRQALSAFYSPEALQTPAKCAVTGKADDPKGIRVVAGHIWPKSAGAIFPLELKDGVNNPSNGIFFLEHIERQFDQLRVCLVCDPFDISATFVVLDEEILQQKVEGTQHTFQDLHQRRLQFDRDKRPSFQLLSRHAQQAFAHSGNKTWMSENDLLCFKSVLQVGSPKKSAD